MKSASRIALAGTAALILIVCGLLPAAAQAEAASTIPVSPNSAWSFAVLAVFVIAYGLVFAEEWLHLRKSKPVLVAAGVIWIIVGVAYAQDGHSEQAAALLRHNALEYAELLFFLLAAMTYINTMIERGVFDAMRGRLVSAGFALRPLFWITGGLAFVISPVADNLTTALVMGTVVMAIGGTSRRFVSGSCVNIVVAANAGGAFSPFGDITTLMVWQHGVVSFGEFFALVLPALVNWVIPAALISLSIPKGKPAVSDRVVRMRKGGLVIVGLFLLTIAGTVLINHALKLPAFLGMMLGLGVLHTYGYFLRRNEARGAAPEVGQEGTRGAFDSFDSLRAIEWDTLLFFYGIILCVGGLGAMGYLALLSHVLYDGLGATAANIAMGGLSAVVDNIPLTFAVISMSPAMDTGQWLLLTLTAGTGGSLLSIGSAAGVAMMGLAPGAYTFSSHMKWSWAILLGYVASIAVHLFVNAAYFTAGR